MLLGFIPLLEATLQLQPDDLEILTQLGMVKSDQGELVEARRLLERAVLVDPSHVHALVSLGVAALRAGDPTSAQSPLEQALALSPGNPYALRALGQAQLMRNDPEGALPFPRQAADTPPGDPITLYALAQALMALDTPEHRKEADTTLTRALALGPPADLAERLRQTHSRLAHQVLRANAAGQPRMDVVAYCATSPTPAPSAPFSSPATSSTVCSSLRRGRMRNLIFSNPVSMERFRVTAMAPTPIADLLQLPMGERLALAMALWDSLDEEDRSEALPLDADLCIELDQRWDKYCQNPEAAIPWEQVCGLLGLG
ncbi:MAG: tetratricopeptide repeat protein [Cyanobacteriota bacterium]